MKEPYAVYQLNVVNTPSQLDFVSESLLLLFYHNDQIFLGQSL